MTSQRSTGGTFARRTRWNHPSRPSGFGQTPQRYKRGDRAIAVIWKMLMVAEGPFRRLKAPELIEDVRSSLWSLLGSGD